MGHSFSRFDQYLYPFFRADVDAGHLSVDKARELLALFWIKLNREGDDIAHLRLSPRHLQGEDGLEQLASLLKTYVSMGGEQLQVTVVDAETLHHAIEAPEQHRDLVVRVAGFTAYFVTLKPELQIEIASRAEATS